jgi:hypothetical protein
MFVAECKSIVARQKLQQEKCQRAYKPGSVLRHSLGDGGCATIPLGVRLPAPSSNLPGRLGRRMPCLFQDAPSLFDFAPGGVYLANDVTAAAVRFYRTLSPLPARRLRPQGLGGLLSVALSLS